MMYAYDKELLAKAQMTLAWMIDTAVYVYGYKLGMFYSMFLNSDISKRFMKGDSAVVAGRSGHELAYMIIEENFPDTIMVMDNSRTQGSPEYWTGWVLAYYQWQSGLSFGNIQEFMPIENIYFNYPKYHEMDILQFVDMVDEVRHDKWSESALKRIRMYVKLSQSELAEKTGISVRTIQQYEQGQKDIRHAHVDSVIKMARALGCGVEDLV